MPLPEHEQRQLQEIEQALYRDDPKFARLMRAGDPRVHHERKLMQALLGVVIGVGLLAAGAVTHRVYLEAAGVVIVLLSLAGDTLKTCAGDHAGHPGSRARPRGGTTAAAVLIARDDPPGPSAAGTTQAEAGMARRRSARLSPVIASPWPGATRAR
jgi:hypothetical protein